jgi:hypothetical protein
MKQTINRYDFERAFVDADRKTQFSYEALGALFDYLEEYEESTGEEFELDVIALCCEYSEEHSEDVITNYSIDVEGLDDDERTQAVRDYLSGNTQLVAETPSGFVYANF